MRALFWFGLGFLLVSVLALAIGCAHAVSEDSSQQPIPHPTCLFCDGGAYDRDLSGDAEPRKGMNWSQEYLKRFDTATCPTAIYIAPGGVLEQCP